MSLFEKFPVLGYCFFQQSEWIVDWTAECVWRWNRMGVAFKIEAWTHLKTLKFSEHVRWLTFANRASCLHCSHFEPVLEEVLKDLFMFEQSICEGKTILMFAVSSSAYVAWLP
jgi:hypothetical protein